MYVLKSSNLFAAPAGTPHASCSDESDCTSVDGARRCHQRRCRCKTGFSFHLVSCCVRSDRGAFEFSLSGEPDPAALLTVAPFAPERCIRLCRQTADCLLLVTDTADSQQPTCALFAAVRASTDNHAASNTTNGDNHGGGGASRKSIRGGISLLDLKTLLGSRGSQAGDTSTENQTANRRTVNVQAFHFTPVTGQVPSSYVTAGDGRRLSLYTFDTAMAGAERCAIKKGIVFPYSSYNFTRTVMERLFSQNTKLPDDAQLIHVGLDRLLTDNAEPAYFVNSRSEAVTIRNWDNGQPGSEPCVAVNVLINRGRLRTVACDKKFPVVCQFIGDNIAKDQQWKRDGRRMTVDLGGLYQIHGVRYAGSNTLAQVVTVSTSMQLGREMSCTNAPPDMAAPKDLYRLLTCQRVTFGRYVHLHFEHSLEVKGEPAVFGRFIRDPWPPFTWCTAISRYLMTFEQVTAVKLWTAVILQT